MKKMMHYGKLLALAGLVGIVSAEAGGSAYFYRRTMMRYNAKTERTMKMSGVDWEQYFSKMKECREWMMEQPHEDVWIRSEDSLKLHGTYFRGSGNVEEKKCKKAVICFHGYTSQGLADYGSISNYYLKRGYNVLLVDQRSHGQSEGKYIGFGCKDRYDAYRWIEWVIGQEGENVQILLHGNSMGGATVLMASGLDLPQQDRSTEAGKRNYCRLSVYFAQGSVYTCTSQYVSSSGVSNNTDCGCGE